MRYVMGFLPVILAGCEGDICALLGQFDGSFEGDLQGDLVAIISEDPKDPTANALAEFTLETADETLHGNGNVICESGDLTLDLTDELDGTAIGYVTGLIGEGSAHGDWNLAPPDNRGGTWQY
jgi:hypothetical protein